MKKYINYQYKKIALMISKALLEVQKYTYIYTMTT